MTPQGVMSCQPFPCSSPVSTSCAAASSAPALLLTQGLCTDCSLCPEHPSIGYLYGSFWSLLNIALWQIPSLDIAAFYPQPVLGIMSLSTLKYYILNTKTKYCIRDTKYYVGLMSFSPSVSELPESNSSVCFVHC